MRERRMHNRAFYTFQDNIPVTISAGRARKVQGTLLNIGQGGLGFAAKRHELSGIKNNQRIMIKELSLPRPVSRLINLEVEIKFIIDLDNYSRISLGCQFLSVSKTQKENIQKLIDQKAEILNE